MEQLRDQKRRAPHSESSSSAPYSFARHEEYVNRQYEGSSNEQREFVDGQMLAAIETQDSTRVIERCLQRMIENGEPIPDVSRHSSEEGTHLYIDPTSNWELAKSMLFTAAVKAIEMAEGTAPGLLQDLGRKLQVAKNETLKSKLIEAYAKKIMHRVGQGRFLFPEKHEEMAAALQRQEAFDAEQVELHQKGEHQYLTVEY